MNDIRAGDLPGKDPVWRVGGFMETKKNRLTHPAVVCALALLCTFLWGSAFPSVKVGYELFSIAAEDMASQIVFAGMRFALAGVLVIGIGSIVNRKFLCPKKSSLGMVGKLAMVQTVLQYLFFMLGSPILRE